ncbi:Uncharacterised protein [Mycobacteroides abscessus subsp. massiliense]|nr:Uncharacterised protein [Mycobacteroides abscessus subsp. massiliense]
MNAYRDSRPARGIPAVHCGEDVTLRRSRLDVITAPQAAECNEERDE